MGRMMHKAAQKAGLSPGTLIYTGERKEQSGKMTVMEYQDDFWREEEISNLCEVAPGEKETVTWLNIEGLGDTGLITAIGELFQLHPLLLEDIVNIGQRPKCDDFEDYLFFVLKMLSFNEKTGEINQEQVSMVLGPNYLLSFQEGIRGDVFDPVRERLRSHKGRLRKLGPDYLAYALIDAVVDNYFLVLEHLDVRLDALEDQLMNHPDGNTLKRMHRLKRELLFLRRSVWPLREALNILERTESDLIRGQTEVYLRDLYDHTIRVIETIEVFQEMLSGMLDIYLSSVSNKMNEVMKVLTIISTIFMPISFLAGLYGMNFKYMPELNWHEGYFAALGVMGLMVIVMIIYFKKKKWL